MAEKRKKTIAFLHPDLGIGGAERLVVDAAVGLQKRGHKVTVLTSHCDQRHCFQEARDGTLDVRVRGNTVVPASIRGRLAVLCAILRQVHLMLHAVFVSGELSPGGDVAAPDAVFVDQVSAGLPLLRWLLPSVPILFYCHFPDLLLAHGRARWWKRLYRRPFDALEAWGLGFADAIVVNSAFTRGVVASTWPELAATRDIKVVYPCIDTTVADEDGAKRNRMVLSINRFERKKNIGLAIRAFAGLSKERRNGATLVVAGGYDERVPENVQHHAELVRLTDELGLASETAKDWDKSSSAHVVFLLSVPDALKDGLLRSTRLLVYTPAGEHFGIVPLEAMLRGTPVLAADTGGPVETVVDGETGWLRDPARPELWTAVMDVVLNDGDDKARAAMAAAGRRRVRERFGADGMAETLEGVFSEMEGARQDTAGLGVGVLSLVGVLLGLVLAAFSLAMKWAFQLP